MKKGFSDIYRKLSKEGIFVIEKTLKKNKTQGFMSSVYMINSNKGELVLHTISPVPEWVRQRIWEKIYTVGEVLMKHKSIPSAQVLLSGKSGDKFFIVQKK